MPGVTPAAPSTDVAPESKCFFFMQTKINSGTTPFEAAENIDTAYLFFAFITLGRGIGAIMGLRLGLACALASALAPASCFFTGTKAAIPSRVGPQHVAHQSRAQASSISMVAQAPIAWPDEVTTPLPDQPIRARILAVAPGDVASPFEDRGKAVPWFEVCAELRADLYNNNKAY